MACSCYTFLFICSCWCYSSIVVTFQHISSYSYYHSTRNDGCLCWCINHHYVCCTSVGLFGVPCLQDELPLPPLITVGTLRVLLALQLCCSNKLHFKWAQLAYYHLGLCQLYYGSFTSDFSCHCFSKLSLVSLFFVGVSYGIWTLISGSDVFTIYTNWGTIIWVYTTAPVGS